MKGDTIAAIATAMTNAGIGIVRISGEESFQIADRICHRQTAIRFTMVIFMMMKNWWMK